MAELTPIIEQAFSQYAGAVLQSRALVDVRDGLKPSARQIFYCLYTDKFTSNKPFKKTLKAIGSASRMYIHGDSSAEGIIMRAGQPFAMRYPLIEVEGSFGNLMESGNWAAPRYTSARLTPFSEQMFNSINKNTINFWIDNYDDTEQYPSVLPSIGVYGLVNGTMGIGIGASSSIPPMNLKEVNEAIIKLIMNPDASFDEIACYPDFPTGATLLNAEEVKESLRSGQGNSCKVRATIKYSPDENCLIVTEIPYLLYTNTICKELETIITENEDSTFIERFNDLTGSTPLIKIYLKKGTNFKRAIEYLYKNTSLESYYTINMTMLKDGKYPRVFGLKECFQEYIAHIRSCKRREIQFDLDKALARKNIVEGLIKAYSIIDQVITLIKSSSNPQDASNNLIQQYGFNEEQTKAILAMKLSSLTKLDIVKLNDENKEIAEKITRFQYLLNTPKALDMELIKILQEVADKFGDERRTKILNVAEETDDSIKPIEEQKLSILLFDNNIIRLVPDDELQGAKKGRRGVKIKASKGMNLINTLYSTNMGQLAAFTQTGRMYSFNLLDLEYNTDYSIYELVNINEDEKIILLVEASTLDYYKYVITITKNGLIKRSLVSEYKIHSKRGLAAVKLDNNDMLINVYLSNSDDDEIMVMSNVGNYNRYKISEISLTGRVTKGIKAIKLINQEKIISSTIIRASTEYKGLITISALGKGKMTSLDEYPITSRAIKGSQVMTYKDDDMASTIFAVPSSLEKIFIIANNKVISLSINDVTIQGRLTNGSTLINTNKKANISIL